MIYTHQFDEGSPRYGILVTGKGSISRQASTHFIICSNKNIQMYYKVIQYIVLAILNMLY